MEFRRPVQQFLPLQTGARHAVRTHGVGDDEERPRAPLFQVRRELRDPGVRGHGFQQEVFHPRGEEQIRLMTVVLRRGEGPFLRGGADAGKDPGVPGPGGVQSQTAPGCDDLVRQSRVPRRQIRPGGEGVGLNGPAPALEVRPVNGGDGVRIL